MQIIPSYQVSVCVFFQHFEYTIPLFPALTFLTSTYSLMGFPYMCSLFFLAAFKILSVLDVW